MEKMQDISTFARSSSEELDSLEQSLNGSRARVISELNEIESQSRALKIKGDEAKIKATAGKIRDLEDRRDLLDTQLNQVEIWLKEAKIREVEGALDRQAEEARAARAEGVKLIKDYAGHAAKIVTIFRRLTEIHRIIAEANSAISLAGRGTSVSLPEEDVANATGQYRALYVDCVLADPSNSVDVIWPPRPAALKVVDKKVGAA